MPQAYSDDERRLLDHLLLIHGKPEQGYGHAMALYRRVASAFNATTKGHKKTAQQIRNYASNKVRIRKKRQAAEKKERMKKPQRLNGPLPPLDTRPTLLPTQGSSDIVCKNVRSLGSPVKKPKISSTTSSSSGYLGSSSEQNDDFRSLSDDLPKSWEYTEIGTSFLTSNDQSSSTLNSDREEPHIFDDIDNFSIGRTSNIDKSGMSSDLVNILSEQARQHHKLKMKLLKEKFRKLSETHKTKMYMMEKELEMKRKEHERKMDILMQKYKSIKNGLEE